MCQFFHCFFIKKKRIYIYIGELFNTLKQKWQHLSLFTWHIFRLRAISGTMMQRSAQKHILKKKKKKVGPPSVVNGVTPDCSQHWHPELSPQLCWFSVSRLGAFANIGWTVQCQRRNICKLLLWRCNLRKLALERRRGKWGIITAEFPQWHLARRWKRLCVLRKHFTCRLM